MLGFPQTFSNLATHAEYLRLGVQVGLFAPAQVVEWAYGVFAEVETPPEGITEIAWSKGGASLMAALSEVPGERDVQQAGCALLVLLGRFVPESPEQLQGTVQRAIHIAMHAKLGEEVFRALDRIDDELSIARTGAYGSVDACRINLLIELSKYQAGPIG